MEYKSLVRFYLNGERKEIPVGPNETVLQMLHTRFSLSGTKKGCEEGDCGACTVVVGKWRGDSFFYEAVASCIYPAAKLDKTHLITVEGLGGPDKLHVVQKELVENNGIQCGFCTPGMVMSLFALFAALPNPTDKEISLALEGNICRCTGYEGIGRAAEAVRGEIKSRNVAIVPEEFKEIEAELKNMEALHLKVTAGPKGVPQTEKYYLPKSLSECKDILSKGRKETSGGASGTYTFLSGGTDIGVSVNMRKEIPGKIIDLSSIEELSGIEIGEASLTIGALTTMSVIREDQRLFSVMPIFREVASKVASQQIRNVATLAGNIANASPIGDFNVLLLGLNANLVLWSLEGERTLQIQDFFVEYRKTAIKENELIKSIQVPLDTDFVSFLKSSKRRAVDIATVNSAFSVKKRGNLLSECLFSVGGVAPVPLLLKETAEGMKGVSPFEIDIEKVSERALREITPIDDVRGSAEFRSTLVKNQLKKHLARLLEREEG